MLSYFLNTIQEVRSDPLSVTALMPARWRQAGLAWITRESRLTHLQPLRLMLPRQVVKLLLMSPSCQREVSNKNNNNNVNNNNNNTNKEIICKAPNANIFTHLKRTIKYTIIIYISKRNLTVVCCHPKLSAFVLCSWFQRQLRKRR